MSDMGGPVTQAAFGEHVGISQQAVSVAFENAIKRREYAPHSALEIVLGDIARQIATRLDALVPQVRRVLPDLPASVIAQLSAEVAACRALCASANLRDADRLQRDDDEEDGLDLFDAPLAGAATP